MTSAFRGSAPPLRPRPDQQRPSLLRDDLVSDASYDVVVDGAWAQTVRAYRVDGLKTHITWLGDRHRSELVA